MWGGGFGYRVPGCPKGNAIWKLKTFRGAQEEPTGLVPTFCCLTFAGPKLICMRFAVIEFRQRRQENLAQPLPICLSGSLPLVVLVLHSL